MTFSTDIERGPDQHFPGRIAPVETLFSKPVLWV